MSDLYDKVLEYVWSGNSGARPDSLIEQLEDGGIDTYALIADIHDVINKHVDETKSNTTAMPGGMGI
jgi:hypothetical protein